MSIGNLQYITQISIGILLIYGFVAFIEAIDTTEGQYIIKKLN